MGNDTVVAITQNQLKTINRSLNDYTYLKDANKLLKSDLSASDTIIGYLKKELLYKDDIIRLDSIKLYRCNELNEAINRSIRDKKSKNILAIIGTGVGGTLLGFFLGVLIK